MNNYNTAYDDVFRTLSVDCKQLLIPVVNEVFHTAYNGNEQVLTAANEIYMKQQEGELEKIITDSSFQILSENGESGYYHLECQSTIDGTMLIRMYEYDSQLALKNGVFVNHTLMVRFPESAVLYLRHDRKTPDFFTVIIRTPKGNVNYDIPIMKVQEYSIDMIFEKGLLFFIPFYIFSYEKQFKELERDKEKLEALKKEYMDIVNRLENLVQQGKITEYIKKTICEMSERVMKKIASKYDRVREEVVSVMGGKVLEYEAKDILRAGKREGRKEGRKEGVLQTLCDLVHDGLLAVEEAARRADMTVEEFCKVLSKKHESV